jgi:hypothetical protein
MAVYDIKLSGPQNEKIAKLMGEGKFLLLFSFYFDTFLLFAFACFSCWLFSSWLFGSYCLFTV